MHKNPLVYVVAFLVVLSLEKCFAEPVFLELSEAPKDGLVVCPIDLTPAANWLGVDKMPLVEFYSGDRKLDAIFVSGSENPLRGTFVAVLPDDVPKGKPCRLRIGNPDGGGKAEFSVPPVADSAAAKIFFDAKKLGGLPSKILFNKNEKNLESLKWFDRLHDPATGSWNISNDKNASVEVIEAKPFLTVVRTAAAFQRPDGSTPSSKPQALYDWFFFPQRELVYVVADWKQNEPTEWKEKHFLELHIPDGSFSKWFGDDKSGTFTGSQNSQTFSRYSGFLDDQNNVIATIAPGTVLYDGLNSFGPYLMPRGHDAWKPWTDTKQRFSAWLWIGNTPDPVKTLQAAYETVRAMPQARIVIPEFEKPAKDWKTAVLNDLFLSGKISSKKELERLRNVEKLPESWAEIERGDLGAILEIADDGKMGKGLRLLSLVDKYTNTVLSARDSLPLFALEVLDKQTGKTVSITSDSGWKNVERNDGSEIFSLTGIDLPDAKNLRVRVRPLIARPGMRLSSHLGISWNFEILDIPDRYELRKLSAPQIALRNLGPSMKVFYPHASGVVKEDPVGKELRWSGTYPSGWCSMQYTAAYDETKKTGLYVDAMDGGCVKSIRVEGNSVSDSLNIHYDVPLPLGGSNSKINLHGGVWRAMNGDWYDAAVIYRNWIRNAAPWYPKQKLGPEGRADTPQWMKELCVWAMCGDSPQKMPETMKKFTEALGVPTGVHWYNWHQIPFDNDYPHYFPTKDGFKEAVAEIQKNTNLSKGAIEPTSASDQRERVESPERKLLTGRTPTYVMPYINGRLWDTRDKGQEDFQFTSVALDGATKKEDGKPYIETYGSKESDGSKVELGVMCPSTEVWKNKVKENTLRLLVDNDVHGVYIDQVAAAKPELCFDKSHGHPLAGGAWWNSEYWDMFEKIRAEMPPGKMLTTECNAEPFVNVFDGYLTWHFQYQDQVPAFAAVYGGSVQMFGRAYRGGPSQVLADRMKAAEQLVYGEQIGWLDPRIVDDPARFPFFKAVVQTRFKHRDYFYKGEMVRPPKLSDEIPTVTADWQWSGETIITTDAVFTGAWRKTDGKGNTVSAVFFFVNVSDKPITSRVAVRFDEIGLKNKAAAFENPLTFEPGVPLAIEIVP